MIQSVERAARILAVLGSGPPRLGVTEIAERVGLAKPTVHGLLRTLEKHDLVAQDPGHRQVQPRARRRVARQRFPGRFGAAGTLAAVGGVPGPAGGRGGLGRHPVRFAGHRAAPRVPPGQHRADPRGRRDDPVARLRAGARDRGAPAGGRTRSRAGRRPGPADRPDEDRPPALSRALAQVRKQGYAVEDQEATVGDAGIAAPILGRDGSVAGAIGVVGAADRLLAAPPAG